MQDLGLYRVEICRGQRIRYQTPLNLLIYRGPFGNYERVTDCSCQFFFFFFFALSSATSFLSRVTVRESSGSLRSKT